MVDVAAVCAKVLAGLDEDVLEYIVGSAAPDGTLELEREDLEEMVVPMLVDAEFCEDDDAAAAKFTALWAALTGGAGGAETEEPKSSEPQRLTGKISLKDTAKRYESAAADAAASRTDLRTLNAEIDVSNTEDDAEAIAKRDAKLTASLAKMAAEVQAETASVNAELASAAQAAAALKITDGAASLTSIECRTFSLPNPVTTQ